MGKIIWTKWELRKEGTILEDGTEVFDKWIDEHPTREGIIAIAKKKHIDPDRHFIQPVGYELIQGIRVPESGDFIYLNQLPEYNEKVRS